MNRWLKIGRRASRSPAVAELKGNIGEQILINGVSFRLVSMQMDPRSGSTLVFREESNWIAENTLRWMP